MENVSVLVWRTAIDLSNQIYRVTPVFTGPVAQDLGREMRQVSKKVPSKISLAINVCRDKFSQKKCMKALHALCELEALFIYSRNAYMIDEAECQYFLAEIDKLKKYLLHFQNYLNRRLRNTSFSKNNGDQQDHSV